ncbi:hypothetical protein BV898_14727 [Hypsibius exemplaris]|uniref:Uncharacterized protein n=1 Tax=Hypsibius exemplaris TaxID=2072580 RepID=A0A9X6N9F6_HYPEX|nr:hypothetical protein BV898_14727 [Hypsibius exemplaris]
MKPGGGTKALFKEHAEALAGNAEQDFLLVREKRQFGMGGRRPMFFFTLNQQPAVATQTGTGLAGRQTVIQGTPVTGTNVIQGTPITGYLG